MPAIGYQKTGTSDKAWDADKYVKRLKEDQDENYYRKMFAWRDPDGDPKTKSAYKFPHHEVSEDGEIGAANIKACQSVIAILNGGMGGADIPDEDRQGVYNHAAHHLRDADVEPAELKKRSRSQRKFEDTELRAFTMLDLHTQIQEGIPGAVLEGHAAVFDQPTKIGDWFIEIIERGAFDKTDFTDVLFCVNHDWTQIPLARSRNNNANSTLQLQVDEQGLAVRAVLDIENNLEAKALYGAVSRKDLTGMSFVFRVRGEKWEGLDTDMPTRRITDIARVFEVSAVSFPAYSGTDISARDQRVLESARRALESARSRLESPKDEQVELLRYKAQLLLKL